MPEIEVQAAPVAKARPRFTTRGGKPHSFTERRTELAEHRIREAWLEAGFGVQAGPVVVSITVYLARPLGHYGPMSASSLIMVVECPVCGAERDVPCLASKLYHPAPLALHLGARVHRARKRLAQELSVGRTELLASAPTFPAGRPDVDNYAKTALDALNGVAFEDDGRVVTLVARKSYAPPGHPPAWVVSVDRIQGGFPDGDERADGEKAHDEPQGPVDAVRGGEEHGQRD